MKTLAISAAAAAVALALALLTPTETVAQDTPPICCGNQCSATAPCCPGTICASQGQCVPAECSECGSRGCRVNFGTCTGECLPPICCFNSCARDGDCCAGTHCGTSADGGRQCLPNGCRDCRGATPLCSVSDQCGAVCVAPSFDCCFNTCSFDRDCCMGTHCGTTASGDRQCLPDACNDCPPMRPFCRVMDGCAAECIGRPGCGNECTFERDCGAGLLCHEFGNGDRRCVPTVFERLCGECGSSGCRFNGFGCGVECVD